VAHIVELDRLEGKARRGNRDWANARSAPPRSLTGDERLRYEIKALVPRLMRYARTLTRDVVAAEDLVQDCIASALRKIHMFEPGSDLRA
jgi:RNA polymerase sigma-70 factor (ECF subfamily)